MYDTNQSRSLENDIIRSNFELNLKLAVLFKAVKVHSEETYLYETQLCQYFNEIERVHSSFIDKIFLKGRGLCRIPNVLNHLQGVEVKLRLKQTSKILENFFKEFFNDNFPPLNFAPMINDVECYVLKKIDDKEYDVNKRMELDGFEEMNKFSSIGNSFELDSELTCPFYPVESQDLMKETKAMFSLNPLFINFSKHDTLKGLKESVRKGLFSFITSKELRQIYKGIKDNDISMDENKVLKKISFKFRIHLIKNNSNFEEFYKNVLEKVENLDIRGELENSSTKLKVDTIAFYDNQRSVEEQSSQVIDQDSLFIIEYRTDINNGLLLRGERSS